MNRFFPNKGATLNGSKVPKGFFMIDGPEAEKLFGLAFHALKVAKQTISIWHGDAAWKEYQASPEMKCINETMEMLEDYE